MPRENILVQPENRGTAAGVMRALVEIQSREITTAPVVLLPSDHYVADERVLHDALGAAVRTACHGDAPVVLLGMSPAGQEAGYGWILPASPGTFARVRRFVEKPPAPQVREMIRDGALINSFILAARAHVLLALIARVFPDILRAFERFAREPEGAPEVRRLYEALPSMDLSRDVLQRATAFLSVVRVPPCGWSDLGTPERLLTVPVATAPSRGTPSAGAERGHSGVRMRAWSRPRPRPGWSVYLLRCADGTLYAGSTTDVEARARAHNDGRGARYTSAGGRSRWCTRRRADRGQPPSGANTR